MSAHWLCDPLFTPTAHRAQLAAAKPLAARTGVHQLLCGQCKERTARCSTRRYCLLNDATSTADLIWVPMKYLPKIAGTHCNMYLLFCINTTHGPSYPMAITWKRVVKYLCIREKKLEGDREKCRITLCTFN